MQYRALMGVGLVCLALVSLPNAQASQPAIPKALTCLKQSYPKHICKVEPNHLIFCDGTRMIYDDGKKRASFEALLNKPSLKDAMALVYPIGEHFPIPLAQNDDPGRIRYTPLFYKIYGSSGKKVRAKTKVIRWAPSGQRLRVSSVYDVHKKLEAVGKALAKLPKKYQKYVKQSSGTFVWRNVKGTKRRSLHSFAVALDIGVKHSYYWNWTKTNKKGLYEYKNNMPIEVVKIFEKHGFIWGGKWYHFDTMHFEYRPELLCMGKTLTKAQAQAMAKQTLKENESK